MTCKKWLYNCMRAFAILNHFCQCDDDDMDSMILEMFPIFEETGFYQGYISYQNGESCTTGGVSPELNLIVEFPHRERKTVTNWFAKQNQYIAFSLYEVNLGTWALEYNLHQLLFDLFGDEIESL